MPPRRTRASAAAPEPEPQAETTTTSTESNQRPSKKIKTTATTTNDIESNQIPPPPPPTIESDSIPLPPQPPPPEPVQDSDAALPPPPPPPPSSSIPPPPPTSNQIVQHEEQEEMQGAEYWQNLAREEENRFKKQQLSKENNSTTGGSNDLYLDTINRQLLDFDFEKVCSVSLSNVNIYACLVCGKYYQGRGRSTHAYSHSINVGHRVFMSLEGGEVYILPENYQVTSPSLSSIRYLLSPTFTPLQISQLDAPDFLSHQLRDLSGRSYFPGFIGLNSIGGKNDYENVILQSLLHVKPFRNYFLTGGNLQNDPNLTSTKSLTQNTTSNQQLPKFFKDSTELIRKFSLFARRFWNNSANGMFKAQISPLELLQEIEKLSNGKFGINKQEDPVEFLSWFLNRLHLDLGGGRKKDTIVTHCFQGKVRIESQQVFVRSGLEEEFGIEGLNHPDNPKNKEENKLDSDGRKEGGQEDEFGNVKFNIDREIKTTESPFLLLALDLPTPPIFQDVLEKNIIPQVPLAQVLAKYDGITFEEARGQIRRYKCLKLPPFLILHFRRFTKNNFVEERNRTIVNFGIKGLELDGCIEDPSMTPLSQVYDLVSNVTHEATAGTVRDDSVWRAQVHTRVDGTRIQDKSEETLRKERELESNRRRKDKGKGKEINGSENLGNGQEDDDDEDEENKNWDGQEKWFQMQDLIVEEINRQMIFLGETYVQIWERRGGPEQVERALRASAAKNKKPSAKTTASGSTSVGTSNGKVGVHKK